MRIFVFIPLIIFQFLFINPFGLANNQFDELGNAQLVFKKYDSEKSLPVLLIEEEVEGTEDSESDNIEQSRPIIHADLDFSFTYISLNSFRLGLSASIDSLNRRDSRLHLFQLYRNLRL